ncbi:MBL fold metallo-hydrolase [Portibacter lacus]|uniref:MBL fold metallo-hydrolase n=1 Tax=Portibacter lacus TaxID=1099794 RepID=A0AA37SPJ9_9BACT|nr:MBL fold metallo-hydrolase [Portibacter lacus]GLR16443.1 MBL fold metallo-hydrolase [Portibacter lacus]
MKLSVIHAGLFKLDGGAMFGVVPKKLWSKLTPADENNMCTWAMRCLLIETGDRKILVDTGMGDKQDEKFRKHFEPHGPFTIEESLQKHGVSSYDITDVFLTHFHFDHVGGALKRDGNDIIPSYENATYWTNEKHHQWALNPNDRERASFLKENIEGLSNHKVLEYIDVRQDISWIKNIEVKFFYGHTEAMMAPIITLQNGQKIAYVADLLPSSYHIRMPYVMSYDIRPLETLKEKKEFLEYAVTNNIYVIFEHDPIYECGKVAKDEKERYFFSELKMLSDVL